MEEKKRLDTIAYHETKQHADAMFAFNIYPCTIPLDFSLVPLHWQDSMEIIYIKKGMGTIQVGFETYLGKAGDIFFVPPGQIHGMRGMYRERMEYENIIFDISFIGGNYPDRCNQKYLQPLKNQEMELPICVDVSHGQYGPISNCLKQAEELCKNCFYGYELGVKASMMQLFACLMPLASEKKEKNLDNQSSEKLKQVLLSIEQDYDKKLTISKVAADCGYSESHFMRWFKEAVGMGFNEYLIEYRLNRAAQELRKSSDTVLDIASQNGFTNLSNFNRLFKKRFGMTPIQYRKELPF